MPIVADRAKGEVQKLEMINPAAFDSGTRSEQILLVDD
jgi:hypothetical protein